nr:MAG TPA: hypothetical protein [Caudoviricetes sp.]
MGVLFFILVSVPVETIYKPPHHLSVDSRYSFDFSVLRSVHVVLTLSLTSHFELIRYRLSLVGICPYACFCVKFP